MAGDKKEALPELCARLSGVVFDTITQDQFKAYGKSDLHTPFDLQDQLLWLLFRLPAACNFLYSVMGFNPAFCELQDAG